MKKHSVALMIDVEDPSSMAKVSEQFARTLSGLAMEELYGSLYIYEAFEEDEE